MYSKNNYYNPTECVKCGKMILNINTKNYESKR